MLKKINYYYFLVLIIYLPFIYFLSELLANKFSQSVVFWAIHWYEPVLVLSVVLTLIGLLRDKPSRKFNSANILAIFLVIFGLISAILLSPKLSIGAEGFRFTILALVFFLVASLSMLEEKQKEKLVSAYVIVSSVVAFWAIIERFLPSHYWQKIGLLGSGGGFGYGSHLAGSVLQSTSFFGGPNQLASYLLPAFFLVLTSKSEKMKSVFKYILLTIFGVIILLTFSRSAIIGLAIVLLIYILSFTKNIIFKFMVVIGLVALLAVAFYLMNNGSNEVKNFLNHGTSQNLHFIAMRDTVIRYENYDLKTKIIGEGLGTSGPIAIKYGGTISESWYLQLLLEIGLLGLALWVTLSTLILIRVIKNNLGLFLGFLSLLITALFLHTFADNPAIAYTIFVLIGLNINKKLNVQNSN